jgi:hypothetical protein
MERKGNRSRKMRSKGVTATREKRRQYKYGRMTRGYDRQPDRQSGRTQVAATYQNREEAPLVD